MITVAALYVDQKGIYSEMPGVETWGEERDARTYGGPHPVIAHPPCSRWCQLAAVNEKRYGHKIGSDGGCFKSSLFDVRRWGGVIEHPAYSKAWDVFGLVRLPKSGGWVRGLDGGWTCHVEQHSYGHEARKATWLYAYGVDPPELRWGSSGEPTAWVSWCKNHGNPDNRKRIGKKAAAATPPAFAEVLVSIARSARGAS